MIYHLIVKPGSSRDEVIIGGDGTLTVRTRKKAHDGEANKAVIELLAEYFGVAKTRIAIKSGAASRHKTVEVR